MPRKYFRKYFPDHEAIRNHKYLRRFRPLLRHPNLWHLNRGSVSGGVAAGMAGGLIPGPFQVLIAASLAILFRVNLPVAVATTFLTNPLTWPFLALAAYALGSLVTGQADGHIQAFEFDWFGGDWGELLPQLTAWFKGLGKTYLIGNALLIPLLSASGYGAVQLGWRLHLLAYLRKRRRRGQTKKTQGARTGHPPEKP